MFSSILFPVDFSERCSEAARFVAAIARQFDGNVTLIHAVGDYTNIVAPDAPSPAAWYEWLRHNAETKLEVFGQPCLDPFVTDRIVEEGEPARVIAGYAKDRGVDLIVMPTHGKGIFRRLLLGSATSKVLHDSACPVWTMTHAEAAAQGCASEIRNLICAIDLSSDNRRVLESARCVARALGASMRLVHAVPVPVSPQAVYLSGEFTRSLEESAEHQIARLQEEAGSAFPVEVDAGEVATVIKNAAEEYKADLVVIGRGVMRGRFGGLRSNVGNIVRESRCPVLSF